MLRLNLYNKKQLSGFMRMHYPTNSEKKEIIQASASEIEKYFSTEDKDEFIVIEFMGIKQDLRKSLSLLSTNIMLKYFIEITFSENDSLESAFNITEALIDYNLYKEPDSFVCMNANEKLQQDEIAIRIIVPHYTYVDVWHKEQSLKNKQ